MSEATSQTQLTGSFSSMFTLYASDEFDTLPSDSVPVFSALMFSLSPLSLRWLKKMSNLHQLACTLPVLSALIITSKNDHSSNSDYL